MEKIKLFQAPTEPEAPLVSKRGGRVIRKIPRGKNRDVSYVTRNMWKYRRNFIESFGLNAT